MLKFEQYFTIHIFSLLSYKNTLGDYSRVNIIYVYIDTFIMYLFC